MHYHARRETISYSLTVLNRKKNIIRDFDVLCLLVVHTFVMKVKHII